MATTYDASFNVCSKLVIEIANAARFIDNVAGQSFDIK